MHSCSWNCLLFIICPFLKNVYNYWPPQLNCLFAVADSIFLNKETHILWSQILVHKLRLELVEPCISFPIATLIIKHIVGHIKLRKIFLNVLNYTFGRKWYLNEASDFAKCLSNLLLYYMCQLPV